MYKLIIKINDKGANDLIPRAVTVTTNCADESEFSEKATTNELTDSYNFDS